MKVVSFYLLLIFFLTSCSNKIIIKTLQPAKVNDSSIKKIMITDIKNDDIGLINIIKSQLNNIIFDNKHYFTIIDKSKRTTILNEQKLLDSGIINIHKQYKLGLEEAHSILNGNIILKNIAQHIYYKTKTNYNKCIKYKNRQCISYQQYQIQCIEKQYILSAFLEIVNIHNGQNIFSHTYTKKTTKTNCSNYMFNDKIVFYDLAQQLALNFVNDISPSYHFYDIILLDKADIEYSANQQHILKKGIKLIKNHNYDDAYILFQELVKKTQYNSYVALYNLAIVTQIKFGIQKAIKYYKLAKNIAIKTDMNDIVIQAYIKAQDMLSKHNKAIKQIKG